MFVLFLRRAAAAFIDLAVVGVTSAVLFLAAVVIEDGIDGQRSADDYAALNAFLLFGGPLLLLLLYPIAMEGSPLQATVAKLIMRLQVRRDDGRRIGVGRAVLRNFMKPLSISMCGAGFLLPIFTRRPQALHDLIAGTQVVDRKSERAEPSAAIQPWLLSADGQWFWDGTSWRPRQAAGPERLDVSFRAPMTTWGWIRAVFLFAFWIPGSVLFAWGFIVDPPDGRLMLAGVVVFLFPILVLLPWLPGFHGAARARMRSAISHALDERLHPTERIVAVGRAIEGTPPWVLYLLIRHAAFLAENKVAVVATSRRLFLIRIARLAQRFEDILYEAPLSGLTVTAWSGWSLRPRLVLADDSGRKWQLTFQLGWRSDAEQVHQAITHQGAVPVVIG